MSEPEYFTADSLAAAAGYSRAQFGRHLAVNVGGLQSARVQVPGLGLRFEAKKCRKYLALCAAGKKLREERRSA